jgi:3-deoxy-D-manno-octulosonic-acid transferase
VLVEAEVWPNLVTVARRRKIPVVLVNARLSVRSEWRFRRFRALVAPTFRCLDLVCVQESIDVDRWHSLGISISRIREVGSIKFDPLDQQPASTLPFQVFKSLQIDASAPVLLGGSTHAGEEEILARAFLRLREQFPRLTLVIVPRHVERVPQIRIALEELRLRVAQRTQTESTCDSPDCLLVDSTGELASWYAVATVVFIGKSITANGGQNPVEPILAKRPVIFGPHMENFDALAKVLVAHKAAVQIAAADELAPAVSALLHDSESRERLVENADRVLAQHRGATARTAELLLALTSSAA